MKTYIASLDFDGTLRVDHMEKETIELLKTIPDKVINVINTGRGIGILKEKIEHFFPEDSELFIKSIKYFICNNGSDIYYRSKEDFDTLKQWSAYLKDQWDRELLLNRLTPLAEKLGFELYPVVYNFKLLYYFHKPSFDDADVAIAEFKASIEDLPVKLVYAQSSQKPPPGLMKFVCEIFPLKAGKGNALIFLKNHLEKNGIPIEAIACFGDDRNDLQTIVDMPLEYDWWYGCLVGNSTDWIIDKAKAAKQNIENRIVIAPQEYPGPLGIEWIMKNLGWMN
ncbi:MAG: HAD-IIB family hydrolase [Cyanobacteriota bacterium]